MPATYLKNKHFLVFQTEIHRVEIRLNTSRKTFSSLCWAAVCEWSLAASAAGTVEGRRGPCRPLGCHLPPSPVPPKPSSLSGRLARRGEKKSANFFRGALCEGPSSPCAGLHKRAQKGGWPPDPQQWPKKKWELAVPLRVRSDPRPVLAAVYL